MVSASDIIKMAPTYIGTPYSEMDCQAFVEACIKDAGRKVNLAGSNAWYRECMKRGWVGTPDECKAKYGKIPKGAFLFILSNNGKEPDKYKGDGIGNASHIGLYTGETGKQMVEQAKADGIFDAEKYNFGDGAMHSSSSRGCVCTSKFAGKAISGGWNRIGLWNEIDYGIGGNEMEEATVILPPGGNGNTVNMRNGASKDHGLVAKVPVGSKVQIVEDDGTWCEIVWDDKRGWMMGKYLERNGGGTQGIEEKLNTIVNAVDAIRSMLGKG